MLLVVGMCWKDIQARWDEIGGSAAARWRELTDDDVRRIAGDRAALVAAVRERLGLTEDDAEVSIDAWELELTSVLALEELPIGEAARHPGRDDVHEQRERDQECEGVVRWPPRAALATPQRRARA